ncbi:MAG: aminotransferase class I/II-fold pyridoxal phosphate-dependent enzyme [Eubacteriales bacterium]|nr:aminotransferase class I/II-fold pyridoxal phosphate-dependent enzyme [Eubacteriales bacterium]
MNLESFLSERAKAIPPSAIRRFFDMANELKGQVISLSIGEPDFVTPWGIREAGIFSLEQGNTHYSPNQGFIELREAITVYLKKRFKLSYQPKSEVIVTVGGSEAIDIAVRAVLNPGDEVIIPEPCFVAYKSCVLMSGGVPVTIATRAEDNFVLLPEQLKAAITPKTKLIMLGYPNNPTGAVMSREQLQAVVDVIKDLPILVMSDELYGELTYEPADHCSIAELDGMIDRTILIGGFSKAFAMTGWRIGYVCGPDTLLAAMNKIHQYIIMSSPTTAQEAAIEALRHSHDHVEPMRQEYNRRRRFVVHACNEMGLACFEPLGAFYAFPNISITGLSSNEFCERFLQEEKVAIVPGTAFGECGEGFVRISYASSMDNIREAMVRLKRFVERNRPK